MIISTGWRGQLRVGREDDPNGAGGVAAARRACEAARIGGGTAAVNAWRRSFHSYMHDLPLHPRDGVPWSDEADQGAYLASALRLLEHLTASDCPPKLLYRGVAQGYAGLRGSSVGGGEIVAACAQAVVYTLRHVVGAAVPLAELFDRLDKGYRVPGYPVACGVCRSAEALHGKGCERGRLFATYVRELEAGRVAPGRTGGRQRRAA